MKGIERSKNEKRQVSIICVRNKVKVEKE